ncbi:short-chain alcohol dehydrogenase [Mycena polygramma]|nr:short-chain alcohol dehydrogenase [Mycena polygramma]
MLEKFATERQSRATSAIVVHGQVDYLVNNAGFVQGSAAEEASATQALAQFNTNFFGLLNTMNTFLPHFRRTGTVVDISSVGPCIGLPGAGMYAASKGELAEYRIRSVSVEPGSFRTEVLQTSNVRSPEKTIERYNYARRAIVTKLEVPLRFVIGDDAVQDAEKFYKERLAELEAARELGMGTSYPA